MKDRRSPCEGIAVLTHIQRQLTEKYSGVLRKVIVPLMYFWVILRIFILDRVTSCLRPVSDLCLTGPLTGGFGGAAVRRTAVSTLPTHLYNPIIGRLQLGDITSLEDNQKEACTTGLSIRIHLEGHSMERALCIHRFQTWCRFLLYRVSLYPQ